jgi:hypothetical protein
LPSGESATSRYTRLAIQTGPASARPVDDIDPATGKTATPVEVEAARAAWAANFVDRGVAKQLTAIAITDHHEMTVVPYVQAELAKPPLGQYCLRLVALPGMELAASGDALIIHIVSILDFRSGDPVR